MFVPHANITHADENKVNKKTENRQIKLEEERFAFFFKATNNHTHARARAYNKHRAEQQKTHHYGMVEGVNGGFEFGVGKFNRPLQRNGLGEAYGNFFAVFGQTLGAEPDRHNEYGRCAHREEDAHPEIFEPKINHHLGFNRQRRIKR